MRIVKVPSEFCFSRVIPVNCSFLHLRIRCPKFLQYWHLFIGTIFLGRYFGLVGDSGGLGGFGLGLEEKG
ncbi:hypothetical protein M0804_013561 [Polistes exclamans]|nr:hypothetical protein M0804_013561 [Polistes exclamans]